MKRKLLLQTLRPDDLTLMESAPGRWKSLASQSAEDNITGHKGVVHTFFFLFIKVLLFYQSIDILLENMIPYDDYKDCFSLFIFRCIF